jgi:hypothetical protein
LVNACTQYLTKTEKDLNVQPPANELKRFSNNFTWSVGLKRVEDFTQV